MLTSQIWESAVAGAISPTEVIGENPDSWQSDVTFTHGLALVLDEEAQHLIDAIRTRLRRAGIPVIGYPGHVTLCCLAACGTGSADIQAGSGPVGRPDPAAQVRRAVSELGMPTRLRLSCAQVLPGASGVVALIVEPEARLRLAHRRLHDRLASDGVTTFNFYSPAAWFPHVSIGFHVPAAQLDQAQQMVAGFAPVEVSLAGISMWTIGTDEQRLLIHF
ncbi:2'-5' RNA ligase family protein [Acidipropionibacterium thoenii]|uniref:2'-5' RNA ligase family protein n=1 Tax=Acidipropionibacterium thoenii TaxID=1751 RepID=UPI000417B33D|nr:2'-5' RNA ligase family protein [Acidipropionibacterium thoenii]